VALTVDVGVMVSVNAVVGVSVSVGISVLVGADVAVAGIGDVAAVRTCCVAGVQAVINNTTSRTILNFISSPQNPILALLFPVLQESNDILSQHFVGIASLHYNDRG
jgi:hypothetical protein